MILTHFAFCSSFLFSLLDLSSCCCLIMTLLRHNALQQADQDLLVYGINLFCCQRTLESDAAQFTEVNVPSSSPWTHTGSNRRPPECKSGALPAELWAHLAYVGRSGLEPPASRLSGVCSNQLSYRPICNDGIRLQRTLGCSLKTGSRLETCATHGCLIGADQLSLICCCCFSLGFLTREFLLVISLERR